MSTRENIRLIARAPLNNFGRGALEDHLYQIIQEFLTKIFF